MQEYFIFDPAYKLKLPLRVFRLRGKELVEEVISYKRVRSEELELELVNDGQTLRLFDPQTGEFLRTQAEEAKARQAAEPRTTCHAAKLRESGLDPDQL